MITPNDEQEFLIQKAVEWFHSGTNQVFEFAGPPGAGKSFVLNEIVTRIGLDPLTEIAPMSFTGSASLVMRMKGLFSARTAHSWIFNISAVPMKDKNGKTMMDKLMNCPIMIPKFIPVKSLDPKIKLIIVDEAYSMPRTLRKTIEKFGIKILACGDPNQLPPVNDEPAFLYDPRNVYMLTKCMRQLGRDDINFISNRVSMGLPLLNGYHGNSLVIDAEDLTDGMLLWADVVICGTNKTRDSINKRIRALRGYTSDLPGYGEKIVCRNNNWLEGIKADNGYIINMCNGLIGTVVNNPDVSSFDGKMFSVDFMPDLAPSSIFMNSRCNYNHMIADNENRIKIRNNKWEPGNKMEFAYCITSHIAQGSQFHKVVYIEEYMHPSIQNKINLVGASRADQQLIYVKRSYQKAIR